MVLAGVMNDVPPYRDVHADGGGKVSGVLRDRAGWWGYRCDDGLLERLETVLLLKLFPCTL
jgi:hypothetical protein